MIAAAATGPTATAHYTIAQYLELEEATGQKWEFFDGEVYVWEAMAGSTPPHARTCNRLAAILEAALDPERCNSFNSDLKLSIHALNRYRYPDLSVMCGPLEYDEALPQAVRNPVLLVEVTSDSSYEADHTSKAKQYMEQVAALRDYLIVEQRKCFATLYSRVDGSAPWTARFFDGPEASLTFPSISVTLALGEVYRNIAWVEGRAVIQLPDAGSAPGAGGAAASFAAADNT